TPTHARWASWRMGNSHGKLLSACGINQALPGAPMQSNRPPRHLVVRKTLLFLEDANGTATPRTGIVRDQPLDPAAVGRQSHASVGGLCSPRGNGRAVVDYLSFP